ncbi:esterase [Desulfobulbus propionicus DSM 2032]|jgi:Predicted esterase|uniref:Esterase n=1 Tax=Desulfobulbus propionicus (strain ATCC 33891 / DSM 2032 / VKM B-1956 / 1pr3) TaxID=577650 RepID=A0A7U3YJN7_DESPD|nr:alpha/beta hydrolase family protein [Desulfobulbus propionicus]ADW16638.1 esterase [Desulfobulbus propionicus DSM 2032]
MALIHCHFFSQVLGLMSSMEVLLPDPDPLETQRGTSDRQKRFSTLYLLHGLSDDHTAWQRRTAIERYLEGLNLAVVMPAVHRSFYANTITGQRYWTFVSEELPAIARHFFPLSAVRDHNYVAGLSMGGYGAFKLALTHPQRYAAAASLSGALDVVRLAKEEQVAGHGEFRHIFGEIDALAGGGDDLFTLAARLVEQKHPRPDLYQWCGTEDFLHADNVRFREHAASLGLSVCYEEGPGGHEWSCWDRQIQRVLAWLPGVGGR